jgi:hypothetical protein
MKTDELEKCIHVIGYWLNEDETVIDKVVHNEKSFVKEFIVPYSKELNINLLLKESNEGKKDLIKFYIFELWELQGFFGYNKNTIEHKPNKKGVVMLKNVDEVKTDYEKYVILCYSYFNLIVEELQLCCGKYNIDFWGICNELGFSTDYFDNGITMIFEEIKNEKSQSQKAKTKQEQPKTFDELFYDTNLISPCIEILKNIEPPLIDTDYNYIGKLKGAFCIWIDEMEKQGIVKHFSDRKIFASLLPQKIKRFTIDESMFGKHHSRAENLYRIDIKTMLSQIKLSQNSQKGKLGK